MAMKYKGKRLKIIRAAGLRFGFGYIPHWLRNQDTDRPREIMVWIGPWIFGWKIEKKGRVPRHWADPSRHRELLKAYHDLGDELMAIQNAQRHD